MGDGICDLCLKSLDVIVMYRKSDSDDSVDPRQFCLKCYEAEGWDHKNPKRVAVFPISRTAKASRDKYRLMKNIVESGGWGTLDLDGDDEDGLEGVWVNPDIGGDD